VLVSFVCFAIASLFVTSENRIPALKYLR
jgi:hypothetical protein